MNKIVIITGASSGIGEQLKLMYENQGDIVINLSLVVEQENKLNYAVDVSNRELVFSVIEKIYQNFKRIDVLINCAGYGVYGAVELTEEHKARQIFEVNYFGTLWCCQAVLKYMKKGARIINISSACSLFCLPYRSMYSASKAAVSMITYGLRMELKNFGIQVACINPGDIKTNFSKNRDITLITNEKYGESIEKSCNKIASHEHKRMSKEFACKKIFKICNKKHLKPMYIIGKKYKFLFFGQKFICTNTLLNLTRKMF